ncbi:mucin-like protein 1 [Microcebus murinus]|uniref:mucin-like protein 1 n=1 Tax=Microcebus murinus TaxID=30608 RepID=UPI000642CF4F|nr:mucin-like protein 1 [Microcebus murinus]
MKFLAMLVLVGVSTILLSGQDATAAPSDTSATAAPEETSPAAVNADTSGYICNLSEDYWFCVQDIYQFFRFRFL